AEYDRDKMSDAIVAYLSRTAGEWQERKDVLEGVEGRTQPKVDALDHAFRSGRVERQGEGKRGKPYLFRVSGTASTPPEKPFFRSLPTVGTAERKPENVASDAAAKSNSVPVFPAPRTPGAESGTESAWPTCPKGHGMTRKAGLWTCTTCPAESPGSSRSDAAPT